MITISFNDDFIEREKGRYIYLRQDVKIGNSRFQAVADRGKVKLQTTRTRNDGFIKLFGITMQGLTVDELEFLERVCNGADACTIKNPVNLYIDDEGVDNGSYRVVTYDGDSVTPFEITEEYYDEFLEEHFHNVQIIFTNISQ